MDDETAVFTLATGILGRLYLSGFIDRMDEHRLALVRDAVALHRRVLTEQQELVPFWPARLPDFDGDWLVVGLRHPSFLPSEDDDPCDYIIVWRRGGTPSVNVPLSEDCHIEQISRIRPSRACARRQAVDRRAHGPRDGPAQRGHLQAAVRPHLRHPPRLSGCDGWTIAPPTGRRRFRWRRIRRP